MTRLASVLSAVALLVSPVLADDPAAPPAAPPDVFLLTGQFLLETDGSTDPSARIYTKPGRPGFLVECASLDTMVLLDPSDRAVRSLDTDLVLSVGEDGRRVMPGGASGVLGSLVPDGPTAGFAVDGHDFRLVPAPHVLGRVSPGALLDGSPEYRRTAAAYEPSESDLARLKAVRVPVQVEVFFGSWCGFCSRFMPRLLRVVDEADNPSLRFSFHGVPRRITLDPDAASLSVTAVPTAVIFAGGREIGRIEGNSWHQPEVALSILLDAVR